MNVVIFLEFNTAQRGPCHETNEGRGVFNIAHFPALFLCRRFTCTLIPLIQLLSSIKLPCHLLCTGFSYYSSFAVLLFQLCRLCTLGFPHFLSFILSHLIKYLHLNFFSTILSSFLLYFSSVSYQPFCFLLLSFPFQSFSSTFFIYFPFSIRLLPHHKPTLYYYPLISTPSPFPS